MPKKKLHWKQNRHSLTRTLMSNRVSMSWNIKVLLRPSLLKILVTTEKLMIILRVRVMMMGINTF